MIYEILKISDYLWLPTYGTDTKPIIRRFAADTWGKYTAISFTGCRYLHDK